jgi:hypothetical protein
MFELLKFNQFIVMLNEEKLTKNDIIKYGDEYTDQIETRKSIKNYLKKLATRIRGLEFVENSWVNPSTSNRGLSNYISIVFKHPDDVTTQEINDNYKYVIRFSDHENVHPEHDVDYEMGVVGKKFGNLSKLGMKFLTKKLPEIQNDIQAFEINKFGDAQTFILDTKTESLRLHIREANLTEKLSQISNNLYCTDYVGNVADLILNKPKAYRLLYDSYFDIWCIADANNWTHDKMAKEMFGSGYVEENSTNQAFTSFMYDAYKWLEKYLKGVHLSNKEIYKSYGFNNLYLTGCMFIPYSDKYEQYEKSSFYSNPVRLKTGILYAYDNYEFSNNGVLKDLYNALLQKDAILDSLDNLWKDCVEKYRDDAIDYFYEEAEEVGYDIDEIEDYLQSHLADAYKM